MGNITGKINVGIDAKWFFSGPPSGNMVVKNLVNEMILHNRDRFNLHLLINSKDSKQAAAYFPAGVNLIQLPAVPNMLSNLLLVPLAAMRYNLKTVLFQNFASTWPGKLHKIAYIHDVLFLDYPEYYTKTERFYFKQMKRLASKANNIIAISASEKERLIANDFAGNADINVVYHGINDSFKPVGSYAADEVYAIINRYQLPAKYLLFVGRVNIRKNLLNLVKAISFVDDKSIPLLIVGEKNNQNAELEKLINEEQLGHRILIIGHVPENDLQLIYACATIFCFPSYAEGFGLPPLEAMKCGVPVVTSDRTAMPEVCGDAAVYIDPDNPHDMARKINALLNNTELYNDKVKRGLERAANFIWAKSAQQILTIIEETSVS
ncbi:glycosyltransferase family 1 protein [Mucilaginibacter conchicola]|uniref:Glycosyltransferase family 1 protein n=1 Tax=Mucilaginibacter conchicola TaxID=2303333 RepID=A0A372NU80_9SPHI|nr:glycosyltransferase family 1 protein [Mucilaginibacter conchicola]RFZ92820.1 glycosyltransferase family 1 protein [Mucilaginibacter conchicola]